MSDNYQLLWECFMSDQMTAKQLDDHIRSDPEFEKWVNAKVKEYRDAIGEANMWNMKENTGE